MLISLDDLVRCSAGGFSTKYECAEFLDVSIEILLATIQYYFKRYGKVHYHKGNILVFDNESVIVLDTRLE